VPSGLAGRPAPVSALTPQHNTYLAVTFPRGECCTPQAKPRPGRAEDRLCDTVPACCRARGKDGPGSAQAPRVSADRYTPIAAP